MKQAGLHFNTMHIHYIDGQLFNAILHDTQKTTQKYCIL